MGMGETVTHDGARRAWGPPGKGDPAGHLILAAPVCIRLYLLAKHITHWRLVILGFVVLAAGTVLSLKKSKTIPQTEQIQGP